MINLITILASYRPNPSFFELWEDVGPLEFILMVVGATIVSVLLTAILLLVEYIFWTAVDLTKFAVGRVKEVFHKK